MSPVTTPAPDPAGPGWGSSVVALVLGIALAVGVSALFGALGWGGELASQTAGASSGAAPLLIDGIRQRRSRRGSPVVTAPRARPTRDWPRKLLVVSCFAFALLVLESAFSWFLFRISHWSVRLAQGPPERFSAVFALLGGLLLLPVVLTALYLFALAAGRRLREHRRRWILLGMGIYALVRVANVVSALATGRTAGIDAGPGAFAAAFLVTLPLMCGVALLGVRRAHRTQAAFDAAVFFRRLDPADREAALALLHDAQPARPRAVPPAPAEPLR